MTDITGISSIFELGQSIVERIWPDPNKRAEEMRALEELKQKGDIAELNARVQLLLGQLEINKAEAQSSSLFVAGWRPFIGWTSGLAFAFSSILYPLIIFFAKLSGYSGEFPRIDTAIMSEVLMGMLGLGIMRSFDKNKGTDTRNIK